jgi:hypothetical protein
MTIADPMVLPPDVVLVPVDELPEEIRAQVEHRPGDHAITRPLARTPSSIVDRRTAQMLDAFRTPTRIVDAILGFANSENLDPRETLEKSFPVLKDLLASGFLVPAGSDLAAPIEASVVPEGASIGPFRVLRTVQLMIDTQLCLARDEAGTFVALKIARSGSEGRAALEHEAGVLRGLDGKVTPRVIDLGEADGRPYLALSWHSGADAERAASELRRLPPKDGRPLLLKLGERIVAAYAQLHGQRVLHGDVHPNNVLVGPDGSVTLIDFGLAVRAGQRGVPRGGVDFFMEPESAAAHAGTGAAAATAAGEQYGLAAMLYRLITGGYTHVFSLEPSEMRRQLLEEPALPFARHDVHGLTHLEAVLGRSLAKSPADRFSGMDELLTAYRTAVGEDLAVPPLPSGQRGAGRRAGRDEGGGLVEDVLDRVSLDGPLLTAELEAPRASVNLGAAGIAYGIARMAMARDDARLLALADLWSIKALADLGSDAAFINVALEITPEAFGTTGLHHSATGVYATEAAIANVRGDPVAQAGAIEGLLNAIRPPGVERDVSFGRSGILLAIATLLDGLPADATQRTTLTEAGGRIAADLWRELAPMGELDAEGGTRPIRTGGPADDRPTGDGARYVGAAHGWAGYLYAQLRWAESSGAAPPPLDDRLAQLARLAIPSGRGLVWPRELGGPDDGALAATWCNGAAGLVPLWTLAERLLGDGAYLALAEGAAWTAYEGPPAPGDLCCGLAGRSYALLDLYRHGGAAVWLARARDLAEQAAIAVRQNALRRDSLYKGEIGVAVLLAELARPDEASMPFYGREPWARPARPS